MWGYLDRRSIKYEEVRPHNTLECCRFISNVDKYERCRVGNEISHAFFFISFPSPRLTCRYYLLTRAAIGVGRQGVW